MPDTEELKRAAAERAAALVRSGDRVGLGTGSTVAHLLEALASRIRRGEIEGLVGVSTSVRTEKRAAELGIPLTTLEAAQPLDLTIDGADEIAPNLDLIKGLGGALLREKMVAQASERLVIIADASKVVDCLGEKAPLPVEVVPFAWESHLPFLAELGSEPSRRTGEGGEPLVTDNGNFIVDCRFAGGVGDVRAVQNALEARAGVVASGLFLGMADQAFVATGEGVVERIASGVAP